MVAQETDGTLVSKAGTTRRSSGFRLPTPARSILPYLWHELNCWFCFKPLSRPPRLFRTCMNTATASASEQSAFRQLNLTPFSIKHLVAVDLQVRSLGQSPLTNDSCHRWVVKEDSSCLRGCKFTSRVCILDHHKNAMLTLGKIWRKAIA